MAIFRGSGGAGDATNNITINRVTELSQEAEASATAAASSATLAANSATSASDSATASASSATDAETAQTAAETAQLAAETAKANTETIYDNFDDRYLGAKSSAPPLDNDDEALLEGALYFNTTDDKLYVWTGSIWRLATSNIEAIADRKTYTVGTASGAYTGSLNTFPIVYDVGQIDVYLNGIKLINGTDFTATSQTDVVLAVDATSGDLINLTGYGIFSLVDGETDPVVGAINGIVKADGAGTISAAVAGTDYIATANSISIGDLSDVDTTGISDNELLVYNSTTSKFEADLVLTQGTYTPEYASGTASGITSVTYDTQIGYYTRIGNMVTVTGEIRTDAVTIGSLPSDGVFITLPFTSSSSGPNSAVALSRVSAFAGEEPISGAVYPNLAAFELFYRSSIAQNDINTKADDLGTGVNSNALSFTVSYII